MKAIVLVKLGVFLITLLLVGITPQVVRAQEDTTIVTDTLYSTPEIDGFIQYSEYYSTLIVNTISEILIVGDGWNWITGGEDHEKSYLSLDLSPLPDSIIVIEATINVYQSGSIGNDTLWSFPIWDVPGGDTLFCIMDHINYGAYLDTSDWGAGDPGNPKTLASNIGIISDDTTIEYKTLDATRYMQADIDAARAKSQFRIRFPIDTDYDDRDDYLNFISSRTSSTIKPYMLIRYKKHNAVKGWGNYGLPLESKLEQNYPNPFNATTVIRYSLLGDRYQQSAISYQPSVVWLKIYNILGKEVRSLVNQEQRAGKYEVVWDGRDDQGKEVRSGIYICLLRAGAFSKARRTVLIR